MATCAWIPLMMVLVFAVSRLGQVAGQDTSFFFNGFDATDRSLQYSGDAIVTANGQLNLTKNAANSVGHTFYGPQIQLLDLSTDTVASFSTNFSFQIIGDYYGTGGEGLAFVLLGSNTSIGDASGGAFLGVYGSNGDQVASTLAIEFDTFKNDKVGYVEIGDINGNHVGLDLSVIKSKIQVDAGSVGVTLADGSTFSSWIDYTASTSTIEVRISRQSAGRPQNPMLSYEVDLSSVLHGSEYVWIGFSAATGDYCFEYHTICEWGFSSWGLPPSCSLLPPAPTPSNGHPVSPSTPPSVSSPHIAPTPWHGGPGGGPVSPPPFTPRSPLIPPPPHGSPAPAPTSPTRSPLPPPPHGSPAPAPTSPAGSPLTPPPHGSPTPAPPSPAGSPNTPPPWHGGPTLPPGSHLSLPPTPVHGGPTLPPGSHLSLPPTPGHGGPSLPPRSSPSPSPWLGGNPGKPINPVEWAVPVSVGCALIFGFFLLFCWRRHRLRPPPPPPPLLGPEEVVIVEEVVVEEEVVTEQVC